MLKFGGQIILPRKIQNVEGNLSGAMLTLGGWTILPKKNQILALNWCFLVGPSSPSASPGNCSSELDSSPKDPASSSRQDAVHTLKNERRRWPVVSRLPFLKLQKGKLVKVKYIFHHNSREFFQVTFACPHVHHDFTLPVYHHLPPEV